MNKYYECACPCAWKQRDNKKPFFILLIFYGLLNIFIATISISDTIIFTQVITVKCVSIHTFNMLAHDCVTLLPCHHNCNEYFRGKKTKKLFGPIFKYIYWNFSIILMIHENVTEQILDYIESFFISNQYIQKTVCFVLKNCLSSFSDTILVTC